MRCRARKNPSWGQTAFCRHDVQVFRTRWRKDVGVNTLALSRPGCVATAIVAEMKGRRLGFLYDNENPRSICARLRRRRLRLLEGLISGLPTPVRILDVGGSESFWLVSGWLEDQSKNLHITLINVDEEASKTEGAGGQLIGLVGDACDLSRFSPGDFDIVFSNSVIEHVGNASMRERMAAEIRRLSDIYFVQTPNKYFPIEPHFLFPFFQFLPLAIRCWLLQHMRLGWIARRRDHDVAMKTVAEVDLLGEREFAGLFPDATIKRERLLVTKSLMAIKS